METIQVFAGTAGPFEIAISRSILNAADAGQPAARAALRDMLEVEAAERGLGGKISYMRALK